MAKTVINKIHKVGRIKMPVARAAHIKCADIVVSGQGLQHIYLRHGEELEKLGYSPLQFVKYVAANYNQIWHENADKVIISISCGIHKKAMVIELSKSLENGKNQWKVLTAFYSKREYFKNKKMLWQKSPLSPE